MRGDAVGESASTGWEFILLFAYLSIAILAATFLRKQVPFLRNLMIPGAIIAGIVLLLSSQQVFGLVEIASGNLELMLYHLLTGVFIVLGLRKRHNTRGKGVFTTTVIVCKSYALLGFLGALFALVWLAAAVGDFFAPFSVFPLLAFGQNSFASFSIDLEAVYIITALGGRAIFTFVITGLLWAYVGGFVMVLWARRRQAVSTAPSREAMEGVIPRDGNKPEGGRLTTTPEGLESFTLHLALIGSVFLITYFFVSHVSGWLVGLGGPAAAVGGILWNFQFIFGAMVAYTVRLIVDWLGVDYLFDEGLMDRASGTLVDFTITAAIASIPLVIFPDFRTIVIILSLLCGAALWFFIYYLSVKMQADYTMERAAGTFALVTGTMPAALAVLRSIDSEMKTPAAEDLAYAGGLALLLGFPLLLFTVYPLYGFLYGSVVQNLLISAGLFAGYGGLLFLVWFGWQKLAQKRAARPDS